MPAEKKVLMTRQRRVLLDELRKTVLHPSADELYDRVRLIMPHISLATVYRNLEILCEAGLIQKVHVGGAQKRFDGNPLQHVHIRCMDCGRVDDLPADVPVDLGAVSSAAGGYRVVGCHIEVTGYCPKCSSQDRL